MPLHSTRRTLSRRNRDAGWRTRSRGRLTSRQRLVFHPKRETTAEILRVPQRRMLIKSVFKKESEEVVAGEAKSGSSGKMVQ